MCGIVGYYGEQNAVPILINGLKRLEYRGYDSAGIAVMNGDGIQTIKKAGKVSVLDKQIDDSTLNGSIGMGHTRWATHGEPNDINAHPHWDHTGKIVLIHNGIIENYSAIKQVLMDKGIEFKSDTDTEVLVQLISDIYYSKRISFEQAVQVSLNQVVGAYGIVTFCSDEPEKLVAARYGSPLVLGLGENEYFIASDASPIVDHTRNVVYLDEGEMVTITKDGHEIRSIADDSIINKEATEIEFSIEEIEKGEYPHHMLKEIHEQVNTITDTLRGRLNLNEGTAHLGGISDYIDRIEKAHRIYITACGTSWHAGIMGKYLLEEYAGIPVHVEYASEFRYRKPIIDSRTVIIAISQSGETADTLAAIKKAKEFGALTVGICNVVGSSIARETDCGIYTHAGPEIGVASTKAFTSQVTVLFLLSLCFGRRNGLSQSSGKELSAALLGIGDQVQKVLDNSDDILEVAKSTVDADNFLYLGRGMNFPVALEGALKLKEISYIHAEGYPAAEMKHGPIALIDENMPVVFLAPHDRTYEKVLSNIQEVKARKGVIITVTNKRTKELKEISDYIIDVPVAHPRIFPLLGSIALQLLAYHLAVLRGCHVDQPRNLAKSVTVE
ncbi:MAG: glutamine--fructose-6-phosphate transaminase (isomerizing) [Candidatus Marinimicrobia bacterium]|jgi:glucosamine--fructose-6-phosphate aminotransferase (isomerizing)|uniref:Glutamine--fructose-6-phosphate aminotransferase [isomerizing] n=1 Tax=uncultured bacterium FPPZ_5C6 TaxID=1343849 RepID=S4WA21_9BACT|nr:aminotransferase [isomerizing] [uncultured bacterium FPPZ_5C6]MBT3676393.1 glutamine--fructose-6-phosphate transaminase (isomerizing) [Candidatus Neomarinimicrobiota bacterium]